MGHPIVFDSRLNKLIEILRFAYRTLRRMGVAQKSDLVPPAFANDERLVDALPDILNYFNIADRKGGKLYFKLRGLSGDRLREYERRVDRLVVLKLKLFQIFFWKAVSRSADEFEPHEKAADIREFLKSYGLPETIADTYVAMMLILGRARTQQGGGGGIRVLRHARLPDGRIPERGEFVVIRSDETRKNQEPPTMGEEKDLYPSLRDFFQRSRTPDEVTEHFEDKGWKVTAVTDEIEANDGEPGGGGDIKYKGTKKAPGLGDMRNPDLVGYRIERSHPMGVPEMEVLCVEVKSKFSRQSVSQAMAYLEFANIVYVAIPRPADTLRQYKLLINACNKHGIGLVSRETDGWAEAIPPRYQVQRRRANAFILEKYFSKDALVGIKNEFYDQMGPFNVQFKLRVSE